MSPDPALLGGLVPPVRPRGRRYVSDAQRYKQYGNAVCAPVVGVVADALTSRPGLDGPDAGRSPGMSGTGSPGQEPPASSERIHR